MRAQKYDSDVYVDMIWTSYISIAFGIGTWDGIEMKWTTPLVKVNVEWNVPELTSEYSRYTYN